MKIFVFYTIHEREQVWVRSSLDYFSLPKIVEWIKSYIPEGVKTRIQERDEMTPIAECDANRLLSMNNVPQTLTNLKPN